MRPININICFIRLPEPRLAEIRTINVCLTLFLNSSLLRCGSLSTHKNGTSLVPTNHSYQGTVTRSATLVRVLGGKRLTSKFLTSLESEWPFHRLGRSSKWYHSSLRGKGTPSTQWSTSDCLLGTRCHNGDFRRLGCLGLRSLKNGEAKEARSAGVVDKAGDRVIPFGGTNSAHACAAKTAKSVIEGMSPWQEVSVRQLQS